MTIEYVDTPRWGSVEIGKTFRTAAEAFEAGFTEPTGRPDVRGKHIHSYIDENGCGWSKFEWALIEEVE